MLDLDKSGASGLWSPISSVLARGALFAVALILGTSLPAFAQQRRDREPNSVYAERRAKLASHIDGPIVLLGYTGREENRKPTSSRRKKISITSPATTKKRPR